MERRKSMPYLLTALQSAPSLTHLWQWKLFIIACLFVGGGGFFATFHLRDEWHHRLLLWLCILISLVGALSFVLVFPN